MGLVPVLIQSDGTASIHVPRGAGACEEQALIDFYASRGMTVNGQKARVVLIRARGPHDALNKAESIRIVES